MNSIQMIKNLMNSKTPKQALQNIVGNSNPMFNNLMQMANSGNNKGIENFARNVCKEKGIDFDKEFNSFMNDFK